MNVSKRLQILEDNNSTSSNFITLKSAVVEATKESIPVWKMDKRNKRMSCENSGLMEERKVAKISDSMKYDELNRKVRCACRHAKEE